MLISTADGNDGDFFLVVVQIHSPSEPYACAPHFHTVGEGDEERSVPSAGTRPPITDSFASPFLGRTVQDCAQYLRGTPNSKDWNKEYFCVLDDDDVDQDTIMVVRRLGGNDVHAFPCPVRETSRKIYTALSDNFEEKLLMYQRITKSEGNYDRSIGTPYEYGDVK